MFKKTFMLILLLLVMSLVVTLVFDMIFVLLRIEPNIAVLPIVWAVTALYVGRIYANTYKTDFSKNLKIKIILYYFVVLLAIILGVLAYTCEIPDLAQLTVFIPASIVPVLLMVIGAFCMYPALGLGYQIELKLLEKEGKKREP